MSIYVSHNMVLNIKISANKTVFYRVVLSLDVYKGFYVVIFITYTEYIILFPTRTEVKFTKVPKYQSVRSKLVKDPPSYIQKPGNFLQNITKKCVMLAVSFFIRN